MRQFQGVVAPKKVVELLTNCTADELVAVNQHVLMLLALRGVASSPVGPIGSDVVSHDLEEHLYYVLGEVLRETTGARPFPFARFKLQRCYRQFGDGVRVIAALCERALPAQHSRATKHALLRLIIKLVIAYMSQINRMVSIQTVTAMLANAPMILHQAFPGYLESGLLYLTLTSRPTHG